MKTELLLELQAGRFSLFEGIEDSIVVDSTYNSSPLSLRKVMKESNEIHKRLYPDSIRLFILGDMRELGESERLHHEQLAEYLKEILTPDDHILLLGQAMTTTYKKIIQLSTYHNIHHFLHFDEVAEQAKEIITELSHNNKHAFVIIKGSQNTIFLEEVTKALLAHPEDNSLLVRQGSWRKHKK